VKSTAIAFQSSCEPVSFLTLVTLMCYWLSQLVVCRGLLEERNKWSKSEILVEALTMQVKISAMELRGNGLFDQQTGSTLCF
jgi:hypothetical protein